MWFSYDAYWTAEQRLSLLRTDLTKPLSVDRVIWPSIFIADFSLADNEWWEVQNALPIPAEFRTRDGLWNDREAMLALLARKWPVEAPVWAIAVTRESTTGMTGALTWPGTLPPAHDRIDDTVDPAWTLLGYDVGESGLWSALAVSSGVDPAVWAGRMNEYHLFPAFEDARAFATSAARRQPKRAPFEVFGIYRIEETRN
jgi:hypothetical protein